MSALPPQWINPAWNSLTADEEVEAEAIIRRFEKAVGESGDGDKLLAEITATLPEGSALKQAVLVELVHSETERKLRLTEPVQSVGQSASFGRLGRYELQRLLGRGSSGTVFLAHDPLLARKVAIKMPHRRDIACEKERELLQHEARAAAGLTHPGIVRTLEVGECGGSLFLVSEYIEGESLQDLIARSSYTFQESARLVRQIAAALFCAHQQGIVHRDLKPSNILLDTHGEPHIADFGTARILSDELNATSTGQLVGTPAYMSPEQAAGRNRDVGSHSDIFSLGVILYETLTGSLPFQGNAATVLSQILTCDPRPPRDLAPALPVDLQTICLKAMAPQPSQRYLSAQDFADDLDRFLGGFPVLARPVTRMERALRFFRRHKAVSISTLLAVTFLITGLATAIWQWRKAERLLSASEILQKTADARFQGAHKAIAAIAYDLRQSSVRNPEDSTDELLRTTADYYSDFVREHGDSRTPEVRRTIAEALLIIADHELSVGEPDKAVLSCQQSIEHWRALLSSTPDDCELITGVARGYLQQSLACSANQEGHTAAMNAAHRGLEFLNGRKDSQRTQETECGTLVLARLHQQCAELCVTAGQLKIAEQHLRNGLQVMKRYESQETSDSLWQRSMLSYHLARAFKKQQAFGEAGEMFAEAARIYQHPLILPGNEGTLFVEQCLFYETEMLCQQGLYEQAGEKCREGISRLDDANIRPSEKPGIRADLLAKFWYFAGQIARQKNDLPEAEAGYQNAISIWSVRPGNDTADSSVERDLGAAYHNLGRIQQELGLNCEAESAYRHALSKRLSLVEKHPLQSRHSSDATGTASCLCDILTTTGQEVEAAELLRQVACSWQSVVLTTDTQHPLRSAADELLAKAAAIRNAQYQSEILIESRRRD